MSREFDIVRAIELPGTPEQVWTAVTQDTDAWLMPTAELGGAKLEWDPPHHGIVRMEAGDWFNQLEYTIDAREGGSFLRYVHSGIFVDDWNAQYDGASSHTDFYLHTLGQYLGHFVGLPFRHIEVFAPAASIRPSGLDVVREALGITSTTAVGDELPLAAPGGAVESAVLDFHTEYFIGLRTSNALYRVFGRNHWGAPVAVGVYRYGDVEGFDAVGPAWEAWLAECFSA